MPLPRDDTTPPVMNTNRDMQVIEGAKKRGPRRPLAGKVSYHVALSTTIDEATFYGSSSYNSVARQFDISNPQGVSIRGRDGDGSFPIGEAPSMFLVSESRLDDHVYTDRRNA